MPIKRQLNEKFLTKMSEDDFPWTAILYCNSATFDDEEMNLLSAEMQNFVRRLSRDSWEQWWYWSVCMCDATCFFFSHAHLGKLTSKLSKTMVNFNVIPRTKQQANEGNEKQKEKEKAKIDTENNTETKS